MKKIIFALSVGLALVARADYIYWMVDNPASGTDISGSSKEFNWANAVLTVQDSGSTYVNSTYSAASSAASTVGGTLSSSQASDFAALETYAYSSIGTDYSSKYILIELFNSQGDWMAGYSAAASSLSSYIFGDNSMSTMPATGFGQGTGATYAVPEPTSGLLFLIGGMLLGLKRRRQA